MNLLFSPREHSYMTSDVFGSFLTYLPTQIRYHQMWLDLPTYPKIWCQTLKILPIRCDCIIPKVPSMSFYPDFFKKRLYNWFTNWYKQNWKKKFWKWPLNLEINGKNKNPNMYGRSDVRSSLTYLPTYIRYHQMQLNIPTYPKIWRHIWMLP